MLGSRRLPGGAADGCAVLTRLGRQGRICRPEVPCLSGGGETWHRDAMGACPWPWESWMASLAGAWRTMARRGALAGLCGVAVIVAQAAAAWPRAETAGPEI